MISSFYNAARANIRDPNFRIRLYDPFDFRQGGLPSTERQIYESGEKTTRNERLELRDRGCEIYPNDMRVKIAASGLYTYPDVAIVCGEPRLEDDQFDTLIN